MIEVLERFIKTFGLYGKSSFIDIEDDRATHSDSPLIFDCMSQNHKLIAIDGSKMRTLCKSARGGEVIADTKVRVRGKGSLGLNVDLGDGNTKIIVVINPDGSPRRRTIFSYKIKGKGTAGTGRKNTRVSKVKP